MLILFQFLKWEPKNAAGDQMRNLQPSAQHQFYYIDHIPSRHGQIFPAIREMGKMSHDLTAQSEPGSVLGSPRRDAEQEPDFATVADMGVRSKS